MKSEFWKRPFRLIRSWKAEDALSTEVALQVAKDHHAKDFPNPLREGCSPYADRFSAFRKGEMPSKEERAHILSCSNCYDEYQTALATYRVTAKSSAKLGRPRLSLQTAVPAIATVLLVVAGIAIYTARDREEIGVQTNINSIPQASPVPSPTVSSSVETASRQPTPERTTRPDDSLVSVNRITIDLENARTVRRRAPEQSPSIELKPVNQVFLIKLPEGSPRGHYKVTLNDPFGKSVRSKNVRSADGKSVSAYFSLAGVTLGRHSICVTREQEVPSCLPVTIRSH